jgi:hypothetical protein
MILVIGGLSTLGSALIEPLARSEPPVRVPARDALLAEADHG